MLCPCIVLTGKVSPLVFVFLMNSLQSTETNSICCKSSDTTLRKTRSMHAISKSQNQVLETVTAQSVKLDSKTISNTWILMTISTKWEVLHVANILRTWSFDTKKRELLWGIKTENSTKQHFNSLMKSLNSMLLPGENQITIRNHFIESLKKISWKQLVALKI